MLKKTITYTDYNGVERTEDFYFNLNTAELSEWQFENSGGLGERLTKIINAKDYSEIAKTFKEIICKAYGVKSDDGRHFTKSEAITQSFLDTEAYNILYNELYNDASYAAKFVKEILPADMQKNIEAAEKAGTLKIN